MTTTKASKQPAAKTTKLGYEEMAKMIASSYPNKYPQHYELHSANKGLLERLDIADSLAKEMWEFFVALQKPGYKHTMPARKVMMPMPRVKSSVELLTDYILAEDHALGLMRKDYADGKLEIDDEVPPLGEGARDFMEMGELTEDEEKRVRVCEICQSNFIDRSRNKMAKVCGAQCGRFKNRLRNRSAYNEKVLGLEDETRRKGDRQRMDLEYGFYNPYEMWWLSNKSEGARSADNLEWMIYKQDSKHDKVRMNGKLKPAYVGRDEFDKKPFNYRTKGREKVREDDGRVYPVITRHISEVIDEPKFVNAAKIEWPKKECAAIPCRIPYIGET
ncbi:hypothetical protein BTO30_02955 [Domibacillus antri]|uniref:Uncharacterized protein n=1 Tax=Domibacillus antri TaxID=1714264 RepID=A0A1Q8Q8T9_9BACI|nr:hypothetical protein [Domibacillus antri]OLN23712.1 hypothetical protein BTO30_02955 [Domibacillus antri]